MTRPARFTPTTAARVLQAAAAEGGVLHITLEGAGMLASSQDLVLRTELGRLVEALHPNADPHRSLVAVALAEGGVLSREPTRRPQTSRPAGRGVSMASAYRDAELAADRVMRTVRPMGGLERLLVPDHARMMTAPELPDLASQVLRLVNGERTVGEVLGQAPAAPELTARILARTVQEGLVHPVQVQDSVAAPTPIPARAPAPRPGEPNPVDDQANLLPSPREMTGAVVLTEVRKWLEGSEVPGSLLSDEAFSSAYSGITQPASIPPAPPRGQRAAAYSPATVSVAASGATPASVPIASTGAGLSSASAVSSEGPPLSSATGEAWSPVPVSAPVPDDDSVLSDAGLTEGWPSWTWIAGALLLGSLLAVLAFWRGGIGPEPDTKPSEETETVIASTSSLAIAGTDTSTVVSESMLDVAVQSEPPPAPRRVRRSGTPTEPGFIPLQQAEALLDAGDAEAAEAILSELRTVRPRDHRVLRLSAQAAMDRGDHKGALRHARKSVARAPRNFENWLVMGSAHQFSGQPSKAVRAYQKALSLDGAHPRADEVRTVLSQLEAQNSRESVLAPRE